MKKELFITDIDYIRDSLLWQCRDCLEQINQWEEPDNYISDIEDDLKDTLWDNFIDNYLSEEDRDILSELEESE